MGCLRRRGGDRLVSSGASASYRHCGRVRGLTVVNMRRPRKIPAFGSDGPGGALDRRRGAFVRTHHGTPSGEPDVGNQGLFPERRWFWAVRFDRERWALCGRCRLRAISDAPVPMQGRFVTAERWPLATVQWSGRSLAGLREVRRCRSSEWKKWNEGRPTGRPQ